VLLAMPVAWALSSVMVRGVAVIPSADIGRLRSPVVSVSLRERFRAGEAADRRHLIAFLRTNRDAERSAGLAPDRGHRRGGDGDGGLPRSRPDPDSGAARGAGRAGPRALRHA